MLIALPPEIPVYHSIIAPVEFAFRFKDEPMQMEAGVAITFAGIAGSGLTIAIAAALVELRQPVALANAPA